MFHSPQFLASTGTNILQETPLLMAPIGVQSIFHASKETGLASVCASLKIPYILSTASTSTIEEVAAASGPGSPRWFQLYWPRTNALTQSLLSRAKAADYTVLVVTLDTFALAWRPADLDESYIPFATGTGNAVGFSDPEFRRMFEAKYPGKSIEENLGLASQEWISEAVPGAPHSWEDLKLLREGWEGKIVLKGIQDPEDARRAVECGMDGIICSNHGGEFVSSFDFFELLSLSPISSNFASLLSFP
jgi:lactate 2-monooxygenase